MATHDVPGSNPANQDVLSAGCWAEHDDGSLVYVKGTERDQVVYEIYDVAQDPPVFYQDAMNKDAFESQFSYNDNIKWLWHDKTPFPWDRVMRTFDKPRPEYADVADQLTAADKVAQSLKLRAQRVEQEEITPRTEQRRRHARSVTERLMSALDAFRG